METSFYTGLGHFCRFLCIAAFAVIGFNATFLNIPMIILPPKADTPAFLSVQGRLTDDENCVLLWKTSVDSAYSFTIEKTRDGSEFRPLKNENIEAGGNGWYSWTDMRTKSLNAYRLHYRKTDGSEGFSPLLVVQTFGSGITPMIAASTEINNTNVLADIQLNEKAAITLKISNKSGMVLFEKKTAGAEGINRVLLAGSDKLVPGEYYLNVYVNAEEKLLLRVVKSK